MTIWRMRVACWIPNVTNPTTEFVILIAFPPQQRLNKRASMLRYTYIVCHVSINSAKEWKTDTKGNIRKCTNARILYSDCLSLHLSYTSGDLLQISSRIYKARSTVYINMSSVMWFKAGWQGTVSVTVTMNTADNCIAVLYATWILNTNSRLSLLKCSTLKPILGNVIIPRALNGSSKEQWPGVNSEHTTQRWLS